MIEDSIVDIPTMEQLNRLGQMSVSSRSTSATDEMSPKERRRQQNRIAQQKYRRKIAQQIKQSKQFAQVHLALTEVARNETPLSRCSECSHCQKLGGFAEVPLAEMPRMSSVPAPSGRTQVSHDLADAPNTTQATSILPFSSQEDFYDDALSPDKIDCDFSFLEHSTPDITGHESSSEDFGAAVVPTELSSQVDRALGNNSASAMPFSQRQDVSGDFLQEIVEADTIISSSASAQTQKQQGLSQVEAAIHMAAQEGHSAIITILLRSGSYVDSRDKKGRTPLYHCAENGHVEAMKILLDSGADPSATDRDGTSILLAAVKAGKERVVEILVGVLRGQ